MENRKFDLVIIGGGPGGYVAAIRASQLGFKVACVEKDPVLGGTCLNVGCIPSKALLESSEHYEVATKDLSAHGIVSKGVELNLGTMMGRKADIVDQLTKGVAFLFKKNKVDTYKGVGTITAPGVVAVNGDEPVTLEAKRILIATGSSNAGLKGVELDGERIGGSTEALSYTKVPRRLVVIGAGVIGLELGSVWRRLGSRVTVLEYMDTILPGIDGEVAKQAKRLFKKQGLQFQLGARVTGARVDGDDCLVKLEGMESVRADRVLVAVGRRPYTSGLGLERLGVEKDSQDFIKVGDDYQTSVPGLFAIGDAIGGAMLAHKASDEGIACVERMATGYGHVDYGVVPSVVYTNPEIAGVGQTEEQLKADAIPYKKGKFLFRANGRALSMNETDGFVKVMSHANTDRLLGVHIIGPRAGDLIAEAVVAMEYGASSEDLARAMHAHPSLSEVLKEAALAVDGRAIHG
jgi:dihydrolipoyl dehydrogenase